MIQIQDLRHRILLVKRTIKEETDGSFTERWQEQDTVWARVVPCEPREAYGEGWNEVAPAPTKYKVTLRYRHQRFERIKWGTFTLALLGAPLGDERRHWMTCLTYVVEEKHE